MSYARPIPLGAFVVFVTFLVHVVFFCLLIFFIIFFENSISMSNSMDPDKARHFVGPDLGPYCLQRL